MAADVPGAAGDEDVHAGDTRAARKRMGRMGPMEQMGRPPSVPSVPFVPSPLPPDPVILPVVRAGAPHRAVLPVEEDGVDRAGGPLLEGHVVAHATELASYPG